MILTKRRSQRSRAVRAVGVTAVVLALGTMGSCSSGGGVETERPVDATVSAAPAPMSASPSPTTTASDADAILAAYREFFARQTEISLAPKEQRRVLLEPFTTNPALDRVLRGMFAAGALGEVGYGAPKVAPTVHNIDGDDATVKDCQDTSKTGRKKRESGKITTRGLAGDNVTTQMRRGTDGVWRVASVDYVDDAC